MLSCKSNRTGPKVEKILWDFTNKNERIKSAFPHPNNFNFPINFEQVLVTGATWLHSFSTLELSN